MLTVPPTKACLLYATPTSMDLYIQTMPVSTYRVQSPGFPKIVYLPLRVPSCKHYPEEVTKLKMDALILLRYRQRRLLRRNRIFRERKNPTMNINSSSNGLSWMAPVPHFLFVCFFFFFVLFFFSFSFFFCLVFCLFVCLLAFLSEEEVFDHITQLFTNLVWCSNAHTAVASFSCDILPQLALLLVGHLAV